MFGWRMELSRNYQCWIMGRTSSREFKKLSFEVGGALETTGAQDRNVEDLVIREIVEK